MLSPGLWLGPGTEASIFRQALYALEDGVVITAVREGDQRLMFVNAGFEQLTGYTADEVIGRNCRFLQGNDTEQPGTETIRQALGNIGGCSVLLRNYRKDGALFWNELTISPIKADNNVTACYLGMQKDVTRRVLLDRDRRRCEQQLYRYKRRLESLVITDELTGLRNRRFLDYLLIPDHWSWVQHCFSPEATLAVFMIDVDHFKGYNDRYGHQQGDACLRIIGRTIAQCFHAAADITIRLGGDEFLAMTTVTKAHDAVALANTLRARLATPAVVAPRIVTWSLTVSIGIGIRSIMSAPAAESLIKTADVALYKAKQRGRDQIVVDVLAA